MSLANICPICLKTITNPQWIRLNDKDLRVCHYCYWVADTETKDIQEIARKSLELRYNK